MLPIIPIREALTDPNLLGAELSGASWLPMRTLAIAAMGEPLTEDERPIFSKLTGGRECESLQRAKRLVVVAGRRSGKSRIAAALAIYFALLCDHSHNLSVGEVGVVLVCAQNVEQAKVVFSYCLGLVQSQPILCKELANATALTVTFKNGIQISVRPSSFRGLRGVTCVAAICDESAFWFTEESASTNPDSEIINGAIQPALMTTRGMLIVISSPYARKGVLWKFYNKHFGPKGDPLTIVAQGASRDFNPSIDEDEIQAALEEDYALAQSEWLGQFRTDLEGFLSMEAIRACVAPGVYEIAPSFDLTYSAFVDAATGSGQDDFAMAIGHLEGDVLIVDALRAFTPPFSPENVVTELSELLSYYGVTRVHGDNFASGFVRELFTKKGVAYEPVKLNTSELYLNLLGTINAKKIQLLDDTKSINQLANLERRTGFAGKDRVSHPVGMHDDVSNVIAGLSSVIRDTDGFSLDMFLRAYGGKPTLYEERAQRKAREEEERRKQEAERQSRKGAEQADAEPSSIDDESSSVTRIIQL
ncbi:hypothetical protein [Methylocystis echinoides]|uniref:hypothetical protein n=1 Tax=Methylocystis echinoides TaxID=29468 RepID=UPI00341AE297